MNVKWLYQDGLEHDPRVDRFHNTDSEQLWKDNLNDPQKKALLDKFGWNPLPPDERCVGDRFLWNPDDPGINDWVELSYQINSHGFRGIEMPTEKKPRSIITIGCSTTMGIGMPVGQIWPTIVGNALKIRAYNLGKCAGSHDSSFRLLYGWLPRIRPAAVFFLEPPGIRYELITNSLGYHNTSAMSPEPIPYRFETEDEWLLSREKTMRAIKSLCEQFNTPFYHTHQDGDDEFFKYFDDHDKARDLQHAGRKRHIFWGMKFLQMAGHEWDFKT